MTKYVILGAGPAGVTAAETIRSIDTTGSIVMVGGEPEQAYSRMAIPYLIYGKIGEQGTYIRQDPDHYKKLNIDYYWDRAKRIDTAHRQVVFNDQTALNYDKLLIATGASPIIPGFPGANLPGVHTCWTLPDAREILKLTEKGTPVVLVGAGFVGSIVLEALHLRGCDLTVVEFAPRMVARMMDEIAGGMLTRWCQQHDVKVFTSTKVEGISKAGDDGSLSVSLSNGKSIPAKLVVLATGVKSNTEFLAGSGIEAGHGIRVNQFMQTNVPDVYAAGDCCEATDLSTGKPDMLAIQPVAVEHARLAGRNMAGIPTPHRGSLNMNVLDTMGLISSSFGLWQGAPDGETARLVDEANFKYLKLAFLGDKLVGAQCVGMTDHVGMLRGLIQTGAHLGPWKDKLMESPERLREAYIATMQKAPVTGYSGPHVKNPAQHPKGFVAGA